MDRKGRMGDYTRRLARKANSAPLRWLRCTVAGRGTTTAESISLMSFPPGSAVIIWQGVIESPDDIVRVQIPVPRAWLAEAKQPVLRIVLCYDPPVNEVAHATWACRKVSPVLHPGPDAPVIAVGLPYFGTTEKRIALRLPVRSLAAIPPWLRSFGRAARARGLDRNARATTWERTGLPYQDHRAIPRFLQMKSCDTSHPERLDMRCALRRITPGQARHPGDDADRSATRRSSRADRR